MLKLAPRRRPVGQPTGHRYHPVGIEASCLMSRLLVGILISAAAGLLGAGANALPISPVEVEHAAIVTPVADGCGINRYRDARGICRRKYVFERHSGKRALYRACGGLNSHRVCNWYGQCWMVCD